MQVAERLFATKGVGATLVADIVQGAGQRNPSALSYHFGSREGVLQAILVSHQERIEQDRSRLLESWPAPGPVTARDVVRLVGQPLVDQLREEPGRRYLCILGQIIDRLDIHATTGLSDRYPSMASAIDLMKDQVHTLPAPVVTERVRAVLLMMTTVLAARARELSSGRRPDLSSTRFRDNLFSMSACALTADLSPDASAPQSQGDQRT